jgi:AcrR family transcriptional regulator
VPVKRERLTHRERQALATKEQVARAARRLFADRGYVATTIAAIAAAADIPAQTIYSAFGDKGHILQHVAWQVTATLDVDRHHDEAVAEPDPARGLGLAANLQRRQYELMYDVVAIYQEAARTDPDIAAALGIILANRERAYRRHVEAISSHLTPGLSVNDAVAIWVTLMLPEIYRTLVIEHGWAPDRYERWLADTLVQQVLGASTPG